MPYVGNKRNEVKDIYNELNLNDIEYIIEPFCGSSAMSYYISTLHPNKFTYILNDNNNYLIELYIILQDDKLSSDFEKIINKLIDKFKDNKEEYDSIKKENDLISWFIGNKYYEMRPFIYPRNKKIKYLSINDYPITKFLRNEKVIMSNLDALDIINKYKDNNKSLLFLDPPYMTLDNNLYKNPSMTIYEYLYENNINDMKCKCVLVLQDNIFTKLLFKNNYKKEYNKRYELSNKKHTHVIISN